MAFYGRTGQGFLFAAGLRCTAALAVALLGYTACSVNATRGDADSAPSTDQQATGQSVSIGTRPIPTGHGIRCQISGPVNRVTPPSYSASDLRLNGVPKLTSSEIETLRLIQKYLHSATLRFAFIGGKFIVYDADKGPCVASAPGYFVLNGACNEYYMPSDALDRTFSIPECVEAPRPWIPGDKSRPRS